MKVQRLILWALLIGTVAVACTEDTPTGSPPSGPDRTLPPSPAPDRLIAWTAQTGPLRSPPIVSGSTVYAASDTKLLAFPLRCGATGATCQPLWTAATGEFAPTPDVVYVGAMDGTVHAYPTQCRTDGASCEPLFRTDPVDPTSDDEGGRETRLTQPAIAGGMIYVGAADAVAGGKPEFDRGRLYAFPAPCPPTGPCAPLWKSPVFDGLLNPPTFDGGRVYVASVSGLHAFSARCATAGETCRPLWKGAEGLTSGMGVNSPIRADGAVLVSAGHGQHGADGGSATLLAFPTDCQVMRCRSVLNFRLRDLFLSSPVVAGGRVFVAASARGIYAFSIRCLRESSGCDPVWRATAPGDFPRRPAVAEDVVYVSAAGGGFAAFPTNCPNDECRPLWTKDIGRRYPSAPAVGADGTVYVASERTLYAFPASCPGPNGRCDPIWTWSGRDKISLEPVVFEDLVFVTDGDRLIALTPPG